MSKSDGPKFIKDPHQKTHFKTDKDLEDFIKCCDPVTGPMYFLSNFFNIQHPKKGSMLFEPFPYQVGLIDTYNNFRHSVSLLPRQAGKCLQSETLINIKNNFTNKEYLIPIGIYHEFIRAKQSGTEPPDIAKFET
ncbi:hypothetical protein UFOVP116_36 [uncultured Caudovirales phage]|uniref:Uncharacterized protein n=1 Tax=uncultured Caudovirales phage TaxID=2100421 RepID=A0A6J5L515_9CAUD|nr:hypothetical protein UFOVP116_36 [uncultured Caudovirales phage]